MKSHCFVVVLPLDKFRNTYRRHHCTPDEDLWFPSSLQTSSSASVWRIKPLPCRSEGWYTLQPSGGGIDSAWPTGPAWMSFGGSFGGLFDSWQCVCVCVCVSKCFLGNKPPPAFLFFLSIVNFGSESIASQWKPDTLCNMYFNLKWTFGFIALCQVQSLNL